MTHHTRRQARLGNLLAVESFEVGAGAGELTPGPVYGRSKSSAGFGAGARNHADKVSEVLLLSNQPSSSAVHDGETFQSLANSV